MDRIISRYNSINKYLPILFVFLTYPTIEQWLKYRLGMTTLWWVVETVFLLLSYIYILSYYTVEYYFWNKKRKIIIASFRNSQNTSNNTNLVLSYLLLKKNSLNKILRIYYPIPVVIYICYVLFSIVHGVFKASNYWDYKFLFGNALVFLMPIICFFYSVPKNIKKTCRVWISFAIIAFLPLLSIMQMECPAKFLFPFAFFIIYWPYYNQKGKLLCVIAFVCVFLFGSLGARSSALRFLASFLFSLFVLYNKKIPKTIYIVFSSLMIIVPIVLLWLGISGQFNIFKLGEYIDFDMSVENSITEGETEDLAADTRTLLYVETISSAVDHNYWLFGNSLSQGYYSEIFTYKDGVDSHGMRYSTEVGMLNIFTFMGIIGVILYCFIFTYSIINVFINSRNKALYALAVLLSFRWLFSFIEEFTYFDLNMAFLWIEIAMCNSPYFLRMDDAQFKAWAHSLLSK